MTPEEYAALDATAIAAAVTAGDVTADEVRAAASTMHERTHQTIHAILEWYDEPSIGSPTGALAGVPFLRKDHGSSEAGRLQEMGSRLTVGHRTTSTSRYYRCLADAGVQVLGRSAVPEFVQHGTTESALFGRTRNPWNPAYSAGGSSGGAAAAVAAGVVPAAHASDCAGSIRIPAAACGLYGLKPTSRRIPTDQGDWGGIAVEFVATRTVRDQHRFFDVLTADTDRAQDEGSEPPLRVGYTLDHWGDGVLGAGVADGVRRVADVLEAAGHEVVEIPPPVALEAVMQGWDAHFGRWAAHDAERFAAHLRRPIDETTVEPVTLHQIERVRATSIDRLSADQLVADTAVASMDAVLEADRIDVVLSATNDRAAIPLDQIDGMTDDFDGWLAANDELFSSLFPANVSGRPAVSVPMGRVGGLPAGAQLMGRRGADRLLLGLAATVEAAAIADDRIA